MKNNRKLANNLTIVFEFCLDVLGRGYKLLHIHQNLGC